MGAYTKLQAVNEMLLLAGETPVTSLDSSTGVDTSIATQILDQKTIDAQARGLANNLSIRDITADGSGVVYIPTDSLSAEMIDLVSASHPDVEYARIVTRGWDGANPYFYNLTDGTNVFTAGRVYSAEIIFKVAWEDMDTPVQKDITTQASRQYQMLSQGDGAVDNYLAQLELYYGAKAKGSDTRSKGYNIFNLHNGAAKATDRTVRMDPSRFRYWRTNK